MKKNTVFLIDDDKDDRMIFLYVLKSIPHSLEFEYAINGLDALEKLSKGDLNPNIIFLDLNMPVMNGKECLTGLRADDRFKDIPIIIFTTSNNEKDISDTKDMGATDFLTKPVDIDVLKNKLEGIFFKYNLIPN